MKVPDSTKASLSSRLSSHAREHHPDLAVVKVRWRTNFAYVDGVAKDGTSLPLCRLRYGGSAATWGFAVYLASRDEMCIRDRPRAPRMLLGNDLGPCCISGDVEGFPFTRSAAVVRYRT